MITAKQIYDGHRIEFQCTEKEELAYLNDHAHDILDNFVQRKIKNIGSLELKTF